MLDVTILAVLQGIAEFLPISSSGHLVIAQHFLGVDAPGMRLDLGLHMGTLVSIFVFYSATLVRIVKRWEWEYALKILLSAIPACLVYYFYKDFVDSMFENPRMVGALLMFTGAVLIGTRYIPRGSKQVSFGRALLMGLGQALALFPGISRSGMTLACARGGQTDPEKAAEFSFLMSAPLILGGMLLELLRDSAHAVSQVSWGEVIYGAAIAAVVGYFSLMILIKVVKGKGFCLFGPYCLAAGLLTLILV